VKTLLSYFRFRSFNASLLTKDNLSIKKAGCGKNTETNFIDMTKKIFKVCYHMFLTVSQIIIRMIYKFVRMFKKNRP